MMQAESLRLQIGSEKFLSSRTCAIVLAPILVSSFLLKLHHLNHQALKGLDESFHAVVAKNLLKHPLVPTLIDRPFLAPADWQSEHIWLHKPILPLWQIALSYLIFGTSTLALRLPSALLSTAAAWITYAIGRDLLDRTTGLIAAALQAFCPAIVMLVHGYIFSDHVDIALLFWTEMGIWLVIRATLSPSLSNLGEGRGEGLGHSSRRAWLYAILAGVAQGLAFLSKSYPALIVTGVAIAAWILARALFPKENARKKGGLTPFFVILIGAAVVAPWMFWCANQFPDQFVRENAMVLAHLGSNVESFAGPWDRIWFTYLVQAMYLFYTPILVAAIVLIGRATRERDVRIWLVIAWAAGVLIPFTLATSKTPSSTLLAWPAMFLLLGAFISRALRGDALCILMWTSITLVACIWFAVFARHMAGLGFRSPTDSARPMLEHLWVIGQVGGGLLAGAIIWRLIRNRPQDRLRILVVVAGIGSAFLLMRMCIAAWKVTQLNVNEPSMIVLGDYVRHNLPENAVLLIDEQVKLEGNTLMFRSDRTCYALRDTPWQTMGAAVISRGGKPYVVSARQLPLKPLFVDSEDQRTLYDWSDGPTAR